MKRLVSVETWFHAEREEAVLPPGSLQQIWDIPLEPEAGTSEETLFHT